jgi:outer membrane protein TolC
MPSPRIPAGRNRERRPGALRGRARSVMLALALFLGWPGTFVAAQEPGPRPWATAGGTLIPPAIPTAGVYPIDLHTALRLAEAENPEIAEARVGILVALAEQTQARALLLPSLNAGANYHGHAGNLQRSDGNILGTSLQSLYGGGGVGTLGAVSVAIPAVNIAGPLTDAIFEPLAARRNLQAATAEAAATSNAILRDVAVLYLELLSAGASLEAQRLSESQAAEVAAVTDQFARTGEGRRSDADRAETTRRLRRAAVLRAEEGLAVASARLAGRLNLDAGVRLCPMASATLAPICLIDASVPAEDMVRVALRRRPEMGARGAALDAARVRVKQEKCRPFLPTIWVGLSGGAFGGGSNLEPPLLGNFAGRTDIDVYAYWNVRNLGVGNLALQSRRRAEEGQALAEQARTINAIRREVISARAEALAAGPEIDYASRGVTAASEGFRDDFIRVREGQGRPIEALNNLDLLADARLDLVRAITRYDVAQFALFVALGSPPPLPPAEGPTSPPPVMAPVHAPIASPARH